MKKYNFFYCTNKKKIKPKENTIQIILSNDRKISENNILGSVHKTKIDELKNEISLLTNIKFEIIRNSNIEIHIHDYDTKYSLLLKINQVQLLLFNFNLEYNVKTQNNQKPTTSIIGGIDRGDNEPISTTNNEHNNSSNEKLTTENKKNEQNIITNSNTDDITRVQSVNRNSNNFNKPPLPPQRINIDPNLNTPTVRTQYYNSVDTNLIKNSEQLNNNTMQKNNIQSQEPIRNQRNVIKGGIDEDQNPNITMLQQPQGGQTQPVFNMDTPPNPNDYKMNTDFQNAMNVYKSYQQNKNLNLEQPNGKPPQMYADDTTATNKYRYLYPTMIFIPLVVIILLIIASSAQLALKIFIVILLIFVLVIYYIQQYNPNVMKYFNKNKIIKNEKM